MKTSTHAEKATARTAVHGVSRSFIALVVAAVAAIATLLTMACAPQTLLPAAHADTGTSSITVVNVQKGRKYNAYRFATFSDVTAAGGSDSTVASLDVTTMPCPASSTSTEQCWNYQLKNAYVSAKNENDAKLPAWDPVYADNVAAFLTTLTGEQLAIVLNYLDMPTGVTPDGSATNDSDAAQDVTISGIPEGWYVVVDTTDGARKAVVATTITANGTTYTKFALKEDTGQSAINDALGKFYAKDVDPQTKPTKHVYLDKDHTAPQPFGNFSIGDTLYYHVDAHISAHAANYDDYTFVIRDQATRGLTVNKSTVALTESDTQDGAETTVPTTDYTVTLTTAHDGTTTMDVSVNSPKAHADKFLHLSYSATINANIVNAGTYTTTVSTNADGTDVSRTEPVVANRVENQARINANKEGWTALDSAVNFTGSIVFTKVGVDSEANGLKNVTFQVFKGASATQSDTNKPLTFTKAHDGVNDGVYNYDPSSTNTNVVSGDDGTVTLQGLAAGTQPGADQQYTLKETSTNISLGYAQSILALFTVDHVIANDGTVTNTVNVKHNNHLGLASGDANAIKVKNVKHFTQLPLTGAAGVALFTLMALVLGGAAAVLTVKYRRTRQQLDESLAD